MLVKGRLPKESGREYALRCIRQSIVGLDLKPGCFLSEQEIATELSISRTPVREALIELSKAQIVEIYPQRGSRVSLIDYTLVEEASFIRLTMESAIIELACKVATAADYKWLEDNLKLQQFYVDNPTPKMLMELDNKFHRYLYQICNKMRCYILVDSMSIHLDRVRSMSLNVIKDNKIVGDHYAIFDAIKSNRPQLAKEYMEKHLLRFQIDKEVISKQYPEYFVMGN